MRNGRVHCRECREDVTERVVAACFLLGRAALERVAGGPEATQRPARGPLTVGVSCGQGHVTEVTCIR